MQTAARYAIYFLGYSFLGAVVETIVRLIRDGQLYGIHGFLHLPIFPIYGFGAIAIIAIFGHRKLNPLTLFVYGALLATVVEFVAHWLIELVFGVRIWWYDEEPFNLYGRISLMSSIGFGVGAILIVNFLHPQVKKVVEKLPNIILYIAASLTVIIVLADTIISTLQRLGMMS